MTAPTLETDSTPACFVEVEEGGLRWHVDAAWRDRLVRGVIRRLDDIRRGAGEVIKHNRMRTVYRVPVPGTPRASVYLKVYRTPTPFERMKSLFVKSRAETEWHLMRLFRENGIPTARPLSYAERRDGRVLADAYFITEAIPDAADLVPYVKTAFPGKSRGTARSRKRAFLARLARLVRAMHERGLFYADLHSGNILVQGDPPEAASLFFIDLHTGKHRRRLAPRTRLKNLARLGHSLLEVTNRADRLRFFLDYARGDAVLGGSVRKGFRRAESRVKRLERRRLRSRAARCVIESSRFTRLSSPELRGFALRCFPEPFWRDVIGGHWRALAGEEGRVLKDGRSTRVTAFTVNGPSGPESVCVKEYRCPSLLDRLKRAVGYRKARRAWLAGNALLVRSVEVAEPIALLLGTGPSGADLLVMRDVSSLPRLDHLVFERFSRRSIPSDPARRQLASEIAEFVRGLHRRGVYHNDLKACNVLVRERGAERRFVLIDYDGARSFSGPVIRRRRIKNLAQLSASLPLSVSLADRVRFFRCYSEGRLDRFERRSYYRGVIEACERKILVRERPIE